MVVRKEEESFRVHEEVLNEREPTLMDGNSKSSLLLIRVVDGKESRKIGED